MEAFFASLSSVAIAEIGDKTQLLTLFLAARFAQKNAIILGIIVATVLNHAFSAILGVWASNHLSESLMAWIVGISFIVVGLWLLVPDKEDEEDTKWVKHGAFVATLVLFFIAEIGDKTQIATVLLAAKYQSFWAVILGSTLGLLVANVPVVYLGEWLMKKIPFKAVRIGACVLFCILGAVTLSTVLF